MTDNSLGLVAARKTSIIINRRRELEMVRKAIYEAGTAVRVVLVRGPLHAEEHREPEGGYGKTRLLEEIVRRIQAGEWQADQQQVVASDLIDLMDIHLHAQSNFLHAVRDSLVDRVDFANYDEAFTRYQRRRTQGVDYRMVREAAERADQLFLSDYQANAQNRRIVWLLDTAEQLAIVSSEWLLAPGRRLLTSEDLQTRTLEWLKRQILAQTLPNTTLLCAGRGWEGRRFFDEISGAAREAYGNDAVVDVHVDPFNEEDTRQYFAVLAEDLKKRATAGEPSRLRAYGAFAKAAAGMADPASERARVVWLYTGGVPVRLALYAQLMVEGRTIPEPLQWSWERAVTAAETDTPRRSTPALELIQWQIEENFINMLFDPRNATDLRYRILRTLVRARRGLTAEQLHFVLDNTDRLSPGQWETIADRRRVRAIDEQLQQMEDLFMAKDRPAWWEIAETIENAPRPGVERRGLQDEIYRIYSEHMSPHYPEPLSPRLQRIWDALPDEQARYRQNRSDEVQARQELYQQLHHWAVYQRQKLQQIQREYHDKEEHALRALSPLDVRRITFPVLGESEHAQRTIIQEAVHELELEYMYYSILLDPDKGFNEDYYELVNKRIWSTEEEEVEILLQSEMWRILNDNDALRFVDLPPRKALFERQETPLLVLRRAAQQEDAARWIKRFIARKKYQRAVEFADSVEEAVGRLRHGNRQDQNDWASWSHTFARGQRQCWRAYALIMQASDIHAASTLLETVAANLEKLAHTTMQEVAIPASRSFAEKDEQGFRGAPEGSTTGHVHHHPGYRMLLRVISLTYNVLGYGCVTQGRLRPAVKYYVRALYYIREVGVLSHRANVLNNLSRALSDMGRQRALRVCRDGLELRKQLGDEVQIAYSRNTLALIYNDRDQPEDAWVEAAQAVAYFRRAEEPRGLGLALLQLGEALRRMANKGRHKEIPAAEAEQLYSVAEDLLNEAHGLFLPADPAMLEPGRVHLNEPLRCVEARIELGCLHRDRIRALDGAGLAPRWQHRYREASNYLDLAAREAKKLGLARHELDARVNQAWTHFYAGDYERAEAVLDSVEKGLKDSKCFILPCSEDHPAGFVPHPSEQDNPVVFAQLSKMCGLHGLVALERFVRHTHAIEELYPTDAQREYRQQLVHEDAEARQRLEQAAEYYSLGAWYAQLFSPRSSALTLLYDRLYVYLKKFNGTEQDDFYRAVRRQRARYPVDEIKANIEDLGNIEHLLYEVLGLSEEILE
jgi:hypothetical protein